MTQLLATADLDERAALLSHELRRNLAERLARLGYQGDAARWPADRGQCRDALVTRADE